MTFPTGSLLVPFSVDCPLAVEFLVRIILVDTLNSSDKRVIPPQLVHFGGLALLWDFHDKTSAPVIWNLIVQPYVLEQDKEHLGSCFNISVLLVAPLVFHLSQELYH